MTRDAVLQTVVDLVPRASSTSNVIVAIDGSDGVGKTVFADELAVVLRADGRRVVRASGDDFHHPRAYRTRRGATSPDGFWNDGFDHARMRTQLLEPFLAGVGHEMVLSIHDVTSDREHVVVDPVPAVSTLVVDGLFLHRDELADVWHASVLLTADVAVSIGRMARRDGGPSDPDDVANQRYVGAQRIYVETCDPARRASVVIDNTVLDDPRVVTPSPGRS